MAFDHEYNDLSGFDARRGEHLPGGLDIRNCSGWGYLPAGVDPDRPKGAVYRKGKVREVDDRPLLVTGPRVELDWCPQVLRAYSPIGVDGRLRETRYQVQVGDEIAGVTRSELDAGDAWRQFSEATGYEPRSIRDTLATLTANLGVARGPTVPIAPPYWTDDDRLIVPGPEDVAGAGEGALIGYGELRRPEGGRAQWGRVVEVLARNPRAALYVGAALGGLFLDRLDLEDILDPLGCCVHAYGEGRQGKTSLQRVIAAALGNPASAPRGLVRSWGGSSVGLGLLAAAVGVLPLVYSDTSSAKRPAELGGYIMSALEGSRALGTQRGELENRGAPFGSIIASSGNHQLTGTLSGTPILSRIIEIRSPLVGSARDAEELKRAARDGHGWPLAQVIAGKVTPEAVRGFYAEAVTLISAHLAQVDHDPVVYDVGRRVAVLVAGARALGELVDAGLDLEGAALAGAHAVLDDLDAHTADWHQPTAQALHSAVWAAHQAEPFCFPDPATEPTWTRKGYLLETGELAVLRRYLIEAGEAAGIDRSQIPAALAALKERGLLVHTKRGRHVGQFKHAGVWVGNVYVFAPIPLITLSGEARATGATARPETGETAGRPPDRETNSRFPRSDKSPGPAVAPVARGFEPEPKIASSDISDDRKPVRNEAPTGKKVSTPEAAGRPPTVPKIRAGGGGRSAHISVSDRPVRLAEVLGRAVEGSRQVWFTKGALAGSDLPETLGRDRHHPWLTLPEGWEQTRPDGGGLDQWMTFAHPAGARVHVVVPAWGRWGTLADLDGPTLQRALAIYREYVGEPYGTPGVTFLQLAKRFERLRYPHPPTDPAVAERPQPHLGNWVAPAETIPEDGYLAAYDRNGSYLAAMNAELPTGEPDHLDAEADLDLSLPGWVRVARVDGLAPGTLDPFARYEDRWIPTPIAKLAGELGATLTVVEALIWPRHHRWLYDIYSRLRQARQVLLTAGPDPAQAAAYATLQATYKQGYGRLAQTQPGWHAMVPANAVANTIRGALRVTRAGGLVVAAGGTDVIVVWQDNPETPPPGLEVSSQLGKWKRKPGQLLARMAHNDPAAIRRLING